MTYTDEGLEVLILRQSLRKSCGNEYLAFSLCPVLPLLLGNQRKKLIVGLRAKVSSDIDEPATVNLCRWSIFLELLREEILNLPPLSRLVDALHEQLH